MRGKDLLECMEQIDDALVEEALEPAAFPRKNNTIAKWGMAAACIVVLGISATAFWSHQNSKEEQIAGQDNASPMAMNASGGSDSADDLNDGSLTAGAVAEDAQADSDSSSMPPELCALPTVEGASGSGNSADSGSDAVSRDSAADAASESENTQITDFENKKGLEQESTKPAYTVISDYYGEKEDSVYDYPVPGKGEFFCYHYLQETMEYYADDPTYAYDVVIDIYGDVKTGDGSDTRYDELSMSAHPGTGSEMIEQEYRRLTELGYTVRLSEDFQLTGTFTKEELDTFQASSEYGYTFRFDNEW